LAHYYFGKNGSKVKPVLYLGGAGREIKGLISSGQYSRYWLMVAARDRGEGQAGLRKALQTRFRMVEKKDFAQLDEKYISFKEKIQKQKSYKAKLSVFLFK
ncbi:MAG: hypothetical protein ABIA67_06420, partial [Candidatus Margulisiibacteriota bacterium]